MAILEIEEQSFDEQVLHSSKPAVVDFFANWCGPCRMLKPILEEVSNENQKYNFFSVNIDNAEALAARYNILSIPCVIVFKNGEVFKRSVGLLPKNEIEDLLGEN